MELLNLEDVLARIGGSWPAIPPPRNLVDRYQGCLRWRRRGGDGDWCEGALVKLTDNGGKQIAYWCGGTKMPPWMSAEGVSGGGGGGNREGIKNGGGGGG